MYLNISHAYCAVANLNYAVGTFYLLPSTKLTTYHLLSYLVLCIC